MVERSPVLPPEAVPLQHYNEAQLAVLHQRISDLMPSIHTIDLEKELIYQFLQAKQMMKDAQTDPDIPLNQKSQLLNSLAAMNKQAATLQKEIYAADQMRRREQALVTALKRFPDLHEAFMEELELLLEGLE